MENVQIFNAPEFGEIRTVTLEDGGWFVGRDVCVVFGDTTPSRSLGRIDEADKCRYVMQTAGGPQEVTLINESGLYALLFAMQPTKANKGGAHTVPPSVQKRIDKLHAFKRWVTHEVLPSIRKHGMYATPLTVEKILNDPDFGIQLLMKYKREKEERAALEAQIERDAPKVVFADAVSVSDSSILIGELAKLLKQNGVENMGQNRLFAWLRNNGYLIRRKGTDYNMPTQRSMEMGLFQIKETAITHSDGHVSVNKTVKVTGKGQQYFINLFLKNTEAKITVTAQLSISETV